jgi:hypothetical protein
VEIAKELANHAVIRTFRHDFDTVACRKDHGLADILPAYKGRECRPENVGVEGEPFPDFNRRCLVADPYDCELHYWLNV